jgi:RNA polymerase sigma-70 factor, ECF subfamily
MTLDERAATLRTTLVTMLPRLRRFARSLAGDRDTADDIVQGALERALARASQWQPDRPAEAWMFGIVRNAWLDETRARARRRNVFDEAVDTALVAAEDPRRDELWAVQQAMARLPEEQRSAVALVLVEGLSYREAADALSIPIGTLTSRLARGRAALQAWLDDAAETNTGEAPA